VIDPFGIRASRVLAKVYKGLHHCPKIHKFNEGREFEYWEVNDWRDLATYDSDELTRLVFAAHDECIRASVVSSGPNMVKIRLHNRTVRTGGSFWTRHPTIEDAIIKFRKST
jgi:hypothetical protein